jgi:lysophospholipase L1-like esterase
MIDLATKALLGPMLYLQARRLRRTALELPEPHGERSGVVGAGRVRFRVLVVGDSSAAGVGARTQDEALAIPLAHNLSRHLGGAVRWQLVAESGRTSPTLLELLRQSRLRRADVAIVIVGVNDITKEVGLAQALRSRADIAAHLRKQAGVRHVAFAALPEMEILPAVPNPLAWYIGRASRRNNRAQARWARSQPGCAHVAMDGVVDASAFCEDGFHPAPALYARVAERLAGHLLEAVERPKPESGKRA